MRKLYLKGCMPSPTLAAVELGLEDEVWTLNAQPNVVEKVPTRHFSLHGLYHEFRQHGAKYLVWLSSMAPTLYLWKGQIELWEDVCDEAGVDLPRPKDVREFPLERILESMPHPRRYFTGSFGYMLAFSAFFGFSEVHIVGSEFSDERLWGSRLKAADWLEEIIGDGSTPPEVRENPSSWRRVLDDLRGQNSGDESWARENIMYWSGRLEAAGVRVVTHDDSHLFANKWLKTHCRDLGAPECGLYGLCECLGGKD